MVFNVIKAEWCNTNSQLIICDHPKCDKSETLHIKMKNGLTRIKSNTICLTIGSYGSYNDNFHISYYCSDCVEKLYKDLKLFLDKKLWSFA